MRMDEEGFRRNLRKNKRSGIDKNAAFVREFEDYLHDQKAGKTLDTAAPEDIESFASWDGRRTRSRNTVYVSAIKYYYEFAENKGMADGAQTVIDKIKEQRVKTRRLTWVDTWMLGMNDAMNDLVDKETRKKILQRCGRSCLSMPSQQRDVLGRFKKLYDESENIDEFLDKVDKEAWLKRDGNLVYSTFGFGRCVCPVIGKLPFDKLPAEWCNCQAGYLKALFEDVLKQPVKVELMKSLRSGAGQCRFRIEL
jgi:predicted hydrocarbon binding protein